MQEFWGGGFVWEGGGSLGREGVGRGMVVREEASGGREDVVVMVSGRWMEVVEEALRQIWLSLWARVDCGLREVFLLRSNLSVTTDVVY